jgi:iron complex outermembrane receptor protein
LTFRPDTKTRVTAYANLLREDNQTTVGFFPWVGTLLPAPFGQIAPERFLSEPDWDRYVVKRWRLGYQVAREIGPQWTLRHQLRYDTLDGDMKSMYSNFWEGFLEDQRSINRTWYTTAYEGHTTSLDLLAEGHLHWGATAHTLLAGMDGGWLWDGTRFLDGAATPLDLYAPVYGQWDPPSLEYGERSPTSTRQLGFFVQDQAKVKERLVLVAGLRRDEVKTDVDGAPEAGTDDGAWSSRLGVVGLAGAWSPYASFSESFEAVGGADVYGTPYKPKRGRQYEIGLRFSPTSRLNVTLAGYDLNEKNRLTPDPDNPINQIQRGEVRVRGFELETTASLAAWDFTANYTYTDGRVVASSDPADPYLNKRLLSIPENSAALWIVRKQRVGTLDLRLGGGVRYVGETWDGQDLLATPDNTLVDATISVARERWRLAVNATNLLDDVYIATCIDRGDCWYGSRRRIAASVGYRF